MRSERYQARYHLFRLRTEADGGPPAGEPPACWGATILEDAEDYGGIMGFSETWDLDADLAVVPRRFTIEEEWNATLRAVVPELPGA